MGEGLEEEKGKEESTHQEEVHFSIFLEERRKKKERKISPNGVYKNHVSCILDVKNGS